MSTSSSSSSPFFKMIYLSLYLSLSISCILSAHLFSAGLGPQPVPAICQAAQSHAGCLQAACERRKRRRRIEEEEEQALSCNACGRSLAVVFELFIKIICTPAAWSFPSADRFTVSADAPPPHFAPFCQPSTKMTTCLLS